MDKAPDDTREAIEGEGARDPDAGLEADRAEDPAFLSEQLITYIGNKRRLLPMIEAALLSCVPALGGRLVSFADVFAGTGIVSRMARRHARRLYINDAEAYSALSNRAYHANRADVPMAEVEAWRQAINRRAAANQTPGVITSLYAPAREDRITPQDRVFYTRRNALFIDAARQGIDQAPAPVRPFLLAPLIQRASVHVNTPGVFKGFYKNAQGVGQFGGTQGHALGRIQAPIDIPFPVLSRFSREVVVSQLDAEAFVAALPPVDVAYLDPPYNQHPYGSNYFMLNLIVEYQQPGAISQVSGIPRDWRRSPYNVRALAAPTLARLLALCPARTLLVSYNSEGFIAPGTMHALLASLGRVSRYDQTYNTFRGCRNLANRPTHVTEWLFKVERAGPGG
ncbi:DNA adenine methylase [Pararhodospirillum oryzae]|uniref:site-specific DNA-methyltransferase (adenine-specific) n=1 Tax=Pararhodospirillum oryzae TaxID=478448 RepID=A0A512H763_9PROT|nr:DNA adenine methylase [Pararhodospirillum oryzae]GEO81268.1 restriction endonuclease subunit M [Pararhodospirillum oryzae]